MFFDQSGCLFIYKPAPPSSINTMPLRDSCRRSTHSFSPPFAYSGYFAVSPPSGLSLNFEFLAFFCGYRRFLNPLIFRLPAAPHLPYINNCRRRHFRDAGPPPELYELRTFFDITGLRSAGAVPARPGVMGSRRETAFGGFGSASCVSAPFPAPDSYLRMVTPIGSPDLGLGPSASGPVRVSPTQSHQLEQAWGTGCGRRRQIEE